MKPRLSAVALLLLTGGCTCGVPAVGQVTFPCHSTADCDAGYCDLDSGVCMGPGGDGGCLVVSCADPTCLGRGCEMGPSPSNCCGGAQAFCVDLLTDPSNCGQCGITCQSGSCGAGLCGCATGSCPGGGDAGFAQQTCTNGVCHCTSGSQCPRGNDCNGGVCSTGG